MKIEFVTLSRPTVSIEKYPQIYRRSSILGHLGPDAPGSYFSSLRHFVWWMEVRTCEQSLFGLCCQFLAHFSPCRLHIKIPPNRQKIVDFGESRVGMGRSPYLWKSRFLAIFSPFRLYRKIPQIRPKIVDYGAPRAGMGRFRTRDPFQLARTFRLVGRSPYLWKSRFLAIFGHFLTLPSI